MKIQLSYQRQGSTLIHLMFLVLMISITVGIAVSTTGSTTKLTQRTRDYTTARLAVEGALEYAFAAWKKCLQNNDGPMSTTALAAAASGLTAPTFTGYSYDTANNGTLLVQATDQYGQPTTTPTGVPIYLAGYPGWSGVAYSYVASARLTQSGSGSTLRGTPVSAGAKRRFQYVTVPIFESMFFYQDNLEMYKPAAMTISGLVHTNSNLYLSTGVANSLVFTSNISYVGSFYQGNGGLVNSSGNTPPPDITAWSGYSSSDIMYSPTYSNGNSQVNQVQAAYPLGADASAVLSATDNNPNNDSFHELIEPPNMAYPDPTPIADRRLYNNAGLIVTISGTSKATATVTVAAQNGTNVTGAQTTALKAAFTSKSTLYDQREGTNVNLDNINVAALTTTLNSVAGFNGVLYIQDTTNSTTPQAVRLQNGGVLPTNGLTIASQNPVYVQGDYNTGTTTNYNAVPANSTGNSDDSSSPTVSGYTRVPAAVMADAVILLSNSWNDSYASYSLSYRNASNTTYNMAMLSGVMPSGYIPGPSDPHYGAAQYGYSGGANNYPRFLENWTGNTCTYYGSMVELFQSKTFTGKWDTGNIYSPPLRRWNFDTNFLNHPPPGTLQAVTISRGSWQRF